MHSKKMQPLLDAWKDSQIVVEEAESRHVQVQTETAADRVQFFEKLSIGSGATIAALVSFLGTHSSVRPIWALRSSLVGLLVAMVSAMTRNYFYPVYRLEMSYVSHLEAGRQLQSDREDYIKASGAVKDHKTGELVDLDKHHEMYILSDEALKAEINAQSKHSNQTLTVWRAAERVCLLAVLCAMAFLIALAWNYQPGREG